MLYRCTQPGCGFVLRSDDDAVRRLGRDGAMLEHLRTHDPRIVLAAQGEA